MSLTFVGRSNQTLYGQIFGSVCTFCIATELKLQVYSDITPNDYIQVHGRYDTNPHNNSMVLMPMRDRKAMEFYESDEVEVTLRNKHRVISTTHNMYQHFCYTREEYPYKDRLLASLINVFKNLFTLKFSLSQIPSGLSKKTGIYIPNKYSEEDIIQRLYNLKQFDKTTTYFLVKNNPTPIDLLSLSRCKELYIPWDDHFSRLAAVCSPFRRFVVYDHPKWDPLIYECPIDHLLSHYITK